jgi:hypothetical protein
MVTPEPTPARPGVGRWIQIHRPILPSRRDKAARVPVQPGRTALPAICYPRQQQWNHDQPDTTVPSAIDLNGDQHILGHIDCPRLRLTIFSFSSSRPLPQRLTLRPGNQWNLKSIVASHHNAAHTDAEQSSGVHFTLDPQIHSSKDPSDSLVEFRGQAFLPAIIGDLNVRLGAAGFTLGVPVTNVSPDTSEYPAPGIPATEFELTIPQATTHSLQSR